MAIVAVTGDSCTTTTVALASAWSSSDDVILVEADPTGGDLAAWLGMPVDPSLSTVVTRAPDGAWSEVERFIRRSDPGLNLIPAPSRAGEAAQALSESARALVPMLAAMRTPVTIVDTGDVPSHPAAHPFTGSAAVTIVVHRQSTQSARAAAVRLQRLADIVAAFGGSPSALVVAVIGAVPFDLREIETLLADAPGVDAIVGLPVDDLAAAVFGGRTGVSERRLARLPLVRAARDLALATEQALIGVAGSTRSATA